MMKFIDRLRGRPVVTLTDHLRRDIGLPRRPEPGPAWWRHL